MKIGQIDFPDGLLQAISNNRLVVFAGAGVSMGEPANLPSFFKLANEIGIRTGKEVSKDEPLDQYLGRLNHRGVRVHELAVQQLSGREIEHTPLHEHLLQLFPGKDQVRLVTTNFDVLFESASTKVWGKTPDIFRAPALPRGRAFSGIVHVHGDVTKPDDIVLTDSDFGRAYLTEGWARRFLVDLFRTYTVLFVGYTHTDTVLQYLARALPGKDIFPRYALDATPNAEQHWRMLGIELITFPKQRDDDFSSLYEGICRLAMLERRGVLDWQREIKALAEQAPPNDQETTDLLLTALKDASKLRFFVQSARNIGWVDWLDRHSLLDPLFEGGRLDESGRLLADWFAEKIVPENPAKALIFLGRHHLKPNKEFWWSLCRSIGMGDPILQKADFERWTIVLLATAPKEPNSYVLEELAERSAKLGSPLSSFNIFAFLCQEQLSVKVPSTWLDEEGQIDDVKTRVEQDIIADHWNLNKVWEECIKPSLGILSAQILVLVNERLQARHAKFQLWGQAHRDWDADSYRRSAIEPHEQDKYPEALDVLIDAGRDALSWLAKNNIASADSWCNWLIAADAPLLRRLAIHGVMENESINASSKVEWLLNRVDLRDSMPHHEIFLLLNSSYPEASRELRERVVQTILGFQWFDDEDPLREERTAYLKFEWLAWLDNARPGCEFASKALNEIKEKFPDFKPSEHPDLTHWHSDATWVGSKSPWSVNELLSRTADQWLSELLSFKGESIWGPDRSGVIENVTGAVKQNFAWGEDLARALVDGKHWDSDLWKAIIRAWSEFASGPVLLTSIIRWFRYQELYEHHSRLIAESLFFLVRDGGKEGVIQVLPDANAIAMSIWGRLDRSGDIDETTDDWLQRAINQTAGILAEYVLSSLSLWVKSRPEEESRGLNDEYKRMLVALLEDQSTAGAYARPILAGQLSYLNYVDDKWVNENLLPLFSTEDPVRLRQVWDGFLVWGKLSPQVVEKMTAPFFFALTNIDTVLSPRRTRFVELFTACVAWYVDDPLRDWLPRFLREVESEDRLSFAQYLSHTLRGIDRQRQQIWWNAWLYRYWNERIVGLPIPLDDSEVEAMLGWVPHLQAVFDKAVAVATRMHPVKLHHGHVLYELKDDPIVLEHPTSVAELILFLLRCDCEPHVLYGIDKILARLGQCQLDQELKLSLVEQLVRKGIDAGPLHP